MLVRGCSVRLPVRYFRAVPARQNILSWFQQRKKQKPAEKVPDTKEVINMIESGKTMPEPETSSVMRLKLDSSDFVGTTQHTKETLIRKQLIKTVPFNAWMSKKRVVDGKKAEKVFVSGYNLINPSAKISGNINIELMSQPFADLVKKFKFCKYIQARTGVMIPDYTITTLTTPLAFWEWYTLNVLSGKLERLKEGVPDAIHLDSTQLPPNVHIKELVSSKHKYTTLKKIYSSVEKAESKRVKRIIENAQT